MGIHHTLKVFTAIVTLSVLTIACRKTHDLPNDPNINDRLIDSVSVSPGPGVPPRNMAIDMDEDGYTDFYIAAGETVPGTIVTALVGSQTLMNFLTDSTGSGYVEPSGEGELIDSVSSPHPPRPRGMWSDYAKASQLVGPVKSGQANGNDFFVGLFTTKIDGIHYGWALVNVSTDGKSIRLKEIAYHRRPRTAVAAGAR